MPYKISWKPSPNKSNGRGGHQPIALVHHRMVGYLNGTDTWFANPDNAVSSHFGIGRRSPTGPVEISQYVDLSDSAWGNGNYSSTGGWPLVKKDATGTVINPNLYTVSIEYEDGSTGNGGVVDDEYIEAGIWLDRILLSGSPLLVRTAGIRSRYDSTINALGAVVPGAETIIDHHRIAGSLKPYCWRPWLDDPGFVPYWKPQFIKALTETDMTIDEIMALLTTKVNELEAQRDAAVTALASANALLAAETAAKNAALTKLGVAKTKGAEIAAL